MKFELDKIKEKVILPSIRYSRTGAPYSLNEILYIMDFFNRSVSIGNIADFVFRHPSSLRFKFLEYRPINQDGSFDWNRTVTSENNIYDSPPLQRVIGKYKILDEIPNISNINCTLSNEQLKKLCGQDKEEEESFYDKAE